MDHKQLDAWKEGVKLVKEIYLLTRSFPKEELYGLTNQLRRAAVSIPSNIAEGSARQSDKEMIQFLYVALGSLSEVETQIIIAIELEYISNNEEINGNITKIRKLIVGLIKYLKGKGK
ncbi:four helix bundle protein [Candidatus Saganbacteria bacterium CG08_land_8_20_14_0_20_45_16]|uniref:Four helix bundle protein n=1 Tax=Candidatus Saganbacteria bacterium CG08_land_8_20_14_0_20_45_16 TaxID=2014293 RepID=A0A2H0XVH0_UNCSA|nr:MAG: four helix bundle protein [Candidatus Saganbacteria bacterium CG08_land_8_20_14_0_20_45_16]